MLQRVGDDATGKALSVKSTSLVVRGGHKLNKGIYMTKQQKKKKTKKKKKINRKIGDKVGIKIC